MAQANVAVQFKQLLTAQYAAIAHGDTATLRTRLSEDLIWVVGANGAELTRPLFLGAVAHAQSPVPLFAVNNVRARRLRDVVLVEYRREDRRQVGAFEVASSKARQSSAAWPPQTDLKLASGWLTLPAAARP